MGRIAVVVLGGLAAAASWPAGAAEPVMVQCGREYQAARAAGTLGGMDWSGFRAACAQRLKAAPAASAPATAASAVASPAAVPTSAAAVPPATGAAAAGPSAMHARQKQCGAEWRAGKATLVAQTPGLTWPKYWSQCNTRLKAAGG